MHWSQLLGGVTRRNCTILTSRLFPKSTAAEPLKVGSYHSKASLVILMCSCFERPQCKTAPQLGLWGLNLSTRWVESCWGNSHLLPLELASSQNHSLTFLSRTRGSANTSCSLGRAPPSPATSGFSRWH